MLKIFIKKIFLISLIMLCHTGFSQRYFIGDKLKEKDKSIEFQTTKAISKPTITFKENKYILKVGKEDLLTSMNYILSKYDISQQENMIRMLRKSINYIASNEDLSFDYLWSGWLDFEEISLDDAENLGEVMLTRILLREHICELIDAGKFQLLENGEIQNKFYFQRVDSNYGGNVKGVFSRNNQLIWICHPFIMY